MRTFVLLLLLNSNFMLAQCGLTTSTRFDGTTIYSTLPQMVGHNNKDIQAGLSIESNKNLDFICLTLRFKEKAKGLKGQLIFTLENNNIASSKFYKSNISEISGSETTIAIFQIDELNLKKLGNSNLKKIKFEFSNGISEEIIISSNSNCLKSTIECLNKKQENNGNISGKKVEQNSKLSEIQVKNGFRDFNFGKTKEEIELKHQLKLLKNDQGLVYYNAVDTDLGTINGTKINEITCVFIENKLSKILINFLGESKVLELLNETFGEPSINIPQGPSDFFEVYQYCGWFGKTSKIEFSLSKLKNSSREIEPIKYELKYELNDFEIKAKNAKSEYLKSKKGDL